MLLTAEDRAEIRTIVREELDAAFSRRAMPVVVPDGASVREAAIAIVAAWEEWWSSDDESLDSDEYAALACAIEKLSSLLTPPSHPTEPTP